QLPVQRERIGIAHYQRLDGKVHRIMSNRVLWNQRRVINSLHAQVGERSFAGSNRLVQTFMDPTGQ
ncbi:MAG TPA: hypothetical protein VMO24_03095, partial [Woeseiaceae bacterium]|nr:hypothetical protein [Woeseiaceae bacterium]